jgi:hypothetical protein
MAASRRRISTVASYPSVTGMWQTFAEGPGERGDPRGSTALEDEVVLKAIVRRLCRLEESPSTIGLGLGMTWIRRHSIWSRSEQKA